MNKEKPSLKKRALDFSLIHQLAGFIRNKDSRRFNNLLTTFTNVTSSEKQRFRSFNENLNQNALIIEMNYNLN